MPWEGVTVTEERQRFLDASRLDCYSTTDLHECFSNSRKTAHPGLSTF